ncbi:GntR family transcriptional regulator [Streptohalobacillus salinus]|uniref:GntR family transcriptional regulator n=1 Tax=Streptohalobacillus salinus TaxID=621096 RepID=A0A2V3WHA9_9BACI|nr:GntR family transcriptional regulator [Streptohalobacillus salinus]PXW92934.1 GntR family transcriptional regulator [Streptohalobacillus salinus]
MIDKHSKIPIYYQLEEAIKTEISENGLQAHDPLPSERIYAEKHGISRMTVRQAINNLVNEGILYRERGRGTFINEQKFEQDISHLTSFSEDMRQRQLTPSTQIISMKRIDHKTNIHDKLELTDEESIYEIVRLRLANQQPIALETIYTPVKLVGNLTENDVEKSFYDYLEQDKGYIITSGQQSIEAALANSEEISQLKLKKNDPILLMQRISYLSDANKTPIEYVKSAYRADRYKFNIEMKRKPAF